MDPIPPDDPAEGLNKQSEFTASSQEPALTAEWYELPANSGRKL